MGDPNSAPLHIMVATTPTDFWNDSCSVEELTYAIERGAVGATTNPTIVLNVLKKEMVLWKDRISQIILDNPHWSETEIAFKLVEEMAVKGAGQLLPLFERTHGGKGRLSIQTNPQFYRNADAIIEQAAHFNTLAPNIQVKVPSTKAGIAAIEEITYRGININATVCCTVPQALAVAEAVERGLNRRGQTGRSLSNMHPVCTIMVGRLDDWIQVLATRDGIIVDPGVFSWPGVAVFKKAYGIFAERGYRTRLLVAAFRHHLHWSEFIGGDVVLTIPYEWQVLYNASDVPVIPRMHIPVEPKILESLRSKFPDFCRAYEPDGLCMDEFDTYGATVRTLRGFISSLHDLINVLRDFMLPNPDVISNEK